MKGETQMQLERSGGTNLVEVLDRVLDKGIVIDAVVRVSIVGFEIISIEARVVVASVETYLKYSRAFAPIDEQPLLDVTPARAGMLPAASAQDAGLQRRTGQRVAA
jgi:hypothetical protein